MFTQDGKDVPLTPGESDYWMKYVLLTEWGIKPFEVDLIAPEDLKALWVLREYQIDSKERKIHPNQPDPNRKIVPFSAYQQDKI